MNSGVYVGTKNYGDYGLISTGDYINPLSFSFRLKDSGKSIEKIQQCYLIIYNINIEWVQLSFTGKMTACRPLVSFDGINWGSDLTKNEIINAENTTTIYPFQIKFIIDDMIDYFVQNNVNKITNFKVKLIYG